MSCASRQQGQGFQSRALQPTAPTMATDLLVRLATIAAAGALAWLYFRGVNPILPPGPGPVIPPDENEKVDVGKREVCNADFNDQETYRCSAGASHCTVSVPATGSTAEERLSNRPGRRPEESDFEGMLSEQALLWSCEAECSFKTSLT